MSQVNYQNNGVNGSAVLTLSDDVGTAVSPLAGNIQLVGHVVEQGSTQFSTVVAGTNLLNINPMSTARWIVDPLGFNGTHTTIGAAITSATSGDTIFIMPGTYTENLTLKSGVNLTCNATDNDSVIILGKLTLPASGTIDISGIQLQTNSDYVISATGGSSVDLNLDDCYLNLTNHTGILMSASPFVTINLYNCTGGLGTTGITLYSMTTSSYLGLTNFQSSDFGASTTASNNSDGTVAIIGSTLSWPISTSGTGQIQCTLSQIVASPAAIAVTTAGTGTSFFSNCLINSGSSAAISVGTGTIVQASSNTIISSATNVFTGAGTIQTGGNICVNSSGNNVSTITHLTVI